MLLVHRSYQRVLMEGTISSKIITTWNLWHRSKDEFQDIYHRSLTVIYNLEEQYLLPSLPLCRQDEWLTWSHNCLLILFLFSLSVAKFFNLAISDILDQIIIVEICIFYHRLFGSNLVFTWLFYTYQHPIPWLLTTEHCVCQISYILYNS